MATLPAQRHSACHPANCGFRHADRPRHCRRKAGYWRRPKSLEALALEMSKRFADVVDADERLAHVEGFGAHRTALLRRSFHVAKPPPQYLVDKLLEVHVLLAMQPLELHRHVVVYGQCRPHTSKHTILDALMSSSIGL